MYLLHNRKKKPMTFNVTINASKTGSIGSKYCERRQYIITAPAPEHVNMLAIERARAEGLEHILIVRIAHVSIQGKDHV